MGKVKDREIKETEGTERNVMKGNEGKTKWKGRESVIPKERGGKGKADYGRGREWKGEMKERTEGQDRGGNGKN